MASKILLHQHENFKDLIDALSNSKKIDEILIEKDYWLMHVLWSMQQLGMQFHLKGGTSLSKGYNCIHRFSEDIDIKIDPDEEKCGFTVYAGKNHDKQKHRESRRNFFDWVSAELEGKIDGIEKVERHTVFDDPSGRYRNGGVMIFYNSLYTLSAGLKNGILLEIGFGKVAPSEARDLSSWAFDEAKTKLDLIDNRALKVPCYEPRYTFVEKLQAVIRKFRLFKEKDNSDLPVNFIRHYYDLYQLIARYDVQQFIGTAEYETFKKEHFGSNDELIIANSDALILNNPHDRKMFTEAYNRSEDLYYQGKPTFEEILARIGKDVQRL